MKGFQHFLRRLVGAGLYLILLTPLLVWHGFLFPHLTAKVLAFQVLVEIVCAAALALVLLQIRRPARPTKWHATTSSLTIGLAVFLIYSVVSSFFGIDLRRSLWGFVDRQDGLILSLHFFAWFALLVWFYSNPRNLSPAEPHGHPVKDKGHSPDRSTAGFERAQDHFLCEVFFLGELCSRRHRPDGVAKRQVRR